MALSLVALLALLVSACGGSDGGDTTGGETSADTTAESGGGGGATSSAGEEVQALLGTPTGEEAGEGLSVTVGSIQALSGPGAFYGKETVRGADLAAEMIEAAGGPTIEFNEKDHKSGDTQAGITTTRELGTEGVPIALVSYSAVLGSILPGVEQYEILSLDGGGGAAPAIQEKPYFYGTRSAPNTDSTVGLIKYISDEYPDVKSTSYVSWDVGPTITGPSKEVYDEAIKEYGISNTGSHLVPIGDSDYSDVIAQLKQENPDAIFSQVYGVEAGLFMKQLAAAGLDIPVFGSDYTPEAGEAGGAAMSNYVFGFDYFDTASPQNEWAEFFVKSYEEKYNQEPSLYSANAYEDTFMVWQLVREAIAEGGDLSSGSAYLAALEANPSFPSLYGGEGEAVGELLMDLKTHAPAKRVQGIYTCDAGCSTITRVATFNTEGSEFQLVE